MEPLLARKLLFVTGKGGVGKTTISAALGLAAARAGRRTIVVEVGDHGRVAELFGRGGVRAGEERRLRPNLSGLTIDPDRVLLEWVQELGGRIPGRVLASSGTFQYFAAAAPGAKELFAMVKVWELTQGRRWQRRSARYDLVVLDAPATGHALGMLGSPRTFGAIARVGPVAAQAEHVRGLLCDPALSGYVGVALGSDMAVAETIEMRDGLRDLLDRDLDRVVVNALLPRRFTAAELDRIAAQDGSPAAGPEARLRHAAARAAHEVHDRARSQHNQVARLRRRGFEVLPVPFVWGPAIDADAVSSIAEHLSRRLQAGEAARR